MKKLSGGVRTALAQYRELASFSQFASDLDDATKAQLASGQRITELLKQKQYAPMSVAQQSISLFAADRGFMDDVEIADLALRIAIVAQVTGIERIRYTTSHPVEFSDRLIKTYAEVPELVSHVHLPVQSGSDKILGSMKRGHTVIEYKSKIRKLREIRPDISLSSDFIIGFPGETEEDFNNTMKLIDEIGFDKSFSFIYSKRPGTIAASLPDDIDQTVKKQRLAVIQDKLNENTEEISRSMIGSIQKVLVEGHSKKGNTLSARTENMRTTHFVGNENLIGQIVSVRITEGFANSLLGELL